MTENILPGIRLAATTAGIRYQGRDDLVLMELAAGSTTAAVFTTNAFCAAPVVVAKEHLAKAAPRYLLINAGNANAGTGASGLEAAHKTCRLIAEAVGCEPEQVLPFSTGVIGEDLPLQPFVAGLPGLINKLSASAWTEAARAIMTTDTVPKLVRERIETPQGAVTLQGMAKGAGMICPDMATMLAFVAVDAAVPRDILDDCLQSAMISSFNAITVDGDTSTNDACVVVATGASGISVDGSDSSLLASVRDGLTQVCERLAKAIVRDAEGATKFITIRVESAKDDDEARRVAYTVAHSPLVKTAFFASDPNWGRILAAVGRSGISAFDIDRVQIWLGDVLIVQDGGRAADYQESDGQRVMDASEIELRIRLDRGSAAAVIHTSDLSHDYVRINAEYRT